MWSERRDGGFTLLEVMAAVAILAIAYISLGSGGMQGLQHEGEARRKLQASLLADSVLSEIEAGIAPALLKSPKSRLQEATQRMTGGRPVYRVIEAIGPDHDKIFRVEVTVGDEVLGMGIGPSRRIAETSAAAEAVEVLEARAAELAEAVAG